MFEQTKKRIFEIDLPYIIDQFKDLGIEHNKSLLSICEHYVNSLSYKLRNHLDITSNTEFNIKNADCSIGTQINAIDPDNTVFVFTPCGLWKDEEVLVTDEFSKIYLGNLLEKYKLEHDDVAYRVSKIEASLKGISNLYESYKQNPLKGDIDSVKESLISEKRTLLLQRLKMFEIDCQIDTILSSVGGLL
jgi:hypothetical protein